MTEGTDQTSNPAHEYFTEVLGRFNVNAQDPSLTVVERVLLAKLRDSTKAADSAAEEASKLRGDIEELNAKVLKLNNEAVTHQVKMSAFAEAVVALKDVE